MKKCILLLLLFLAIIFSDYQNLYAQNVLWAKKGISEGFENGNAIVADDSGNVYVTGQIEFVSVFDNVVLNAYGQHDIFVAKYGAEGKLKWIRQAGGKDGDIGNGIGIDALHNVYVTGEFEDTAKFGSITKITSGFNDGFITKYDANGNVVWVNTFGCPTSSDKGRALAVSPSGNTYITGNFSVISNFSGLTLSASGANDIFVVKYDTNGEIQWVKKAGGIGMDRGYGLTIDASENVYVTGTFTKSASFSGTTITNPGNHSAFLAKYNSNGSFQWVRESGACCDTTKSNSISLDENGNIYIAGYFMDTTKFGNYSLNSVGLSDTYLAKYSPNGDVVWVKRAGGIDEDGAYGVVVDTINHLVYVTGLVRDQGYFDNLPYTIVGYKDIFIAAYDMDGNVIWIKTYGGTSRDVGAAITVDPAGYIYSTGLFNGIANFDGITLTGYPNQPWADFFVNKISPATASSPSIQSTGLLVTSGQCSDLDISFTPGNGNRRIIVAHESTSVNIYPLNGNIYKSNPVFGNGSNLGNNNYVVYNGTGNNATVTNLSPGTTYYFSIFEYNGIGITSNYLTNNPASFVATTATFSISISSLQNTICDGDSLVLNATGATNYSWSPLTSLSFISDSIAIAKPISTTTYLINGKTNDGCYAESKITIEVNKLPEVIFPALNALCLNNPSLNLNSGTPAGGIYSGTGVSESMFSPATAGSGIHLLSYEYSDSKGCTNIAQSSIQVRSTPGVILSTTASLCENESPFILNNGSPAGGIYSGPGITTNMFDPSIGQGAHQIYYSYTNNNGCTGTTSAYMVVKSAPTINLGHDLIACAENKVLLNAPLGFSSYNWSTGETVTSIIVDSNGTGLGLKNISLQISNNSGCFNSDTIEIVFDLCAGMISKETVLNNVTVSPNPFQYNIKLSIDKYTSISVYDLCGKLVQQINEGPGNVTLGETLNSGVYFIEVISGINKKVFSVMKSQF